MGSKGGSSNSTGTVTRVTSPPGGKDKPAPWPNPPTPPKSPEQTRASLANGTGGRSTPHLRLDTSSNAGPGPSTTTATGTTTVPPTSVVATHQTTKAINDLLNAMQQTLGALGNTFDVLGEQTLSVATLGPAVDAVIKIDKARKVVQDRHAAQDAAMKSTEDGVKEQVAVAIREKLRPKVDQLVAETVARLVQDRVRDELRKQVSQKLKDELEEHRRRILEVKIALVNAEAVRHNAHIPHEQFDQPLLRPLLRPFAVGAPLGTPDGAANGAGDTRLTAQDKKNGGKNAKKNGAANGNGVGAGGSANANAGGTANRDAPAGVAAGVPSPLFPRSVYDFRAMEARPARQLVLDYGLAGGDGQEEEDWDDDASTVKDEKETVKKGNTSKDDKTPKTESAKQKEEREKKEAERKAAREAKLYAREVRRTEHLNDFMRFIGLGRLALEPMPLRRGANGEVVVQSRLKERSQ